MKFTMQDSYNSIQAYEGIKPYMEILFSNFLEELYPEDVRELSLEEAEKVIRETPWGEPFTVINEQLLAAANESLQLMGDYGEGRRCCIPLWNLSNKDWFFPKKRDHGYERVFLIAPVVTQCEKGKKPAVIICPGGGYEDVCFTNEGSPIQNFMEENGFIPFILNYRVAPDVYPHPQMDLTLAILYVRAHCVAYGVDPAKIGVMGSSAGGHLCAYQPIIHDSLKNWTIEELEQRQEDTKVYEHLSSRPDFICLNYPVISFVKEMHEGSFQCLTKGKEELREELSVENRIEADYPPTFVWACEDDEIVPCSNAVRMGKALKSKNIPYECHIYPSGGHGCGLAKYKEAKNWSLEFLRWQRLL
jgi:acetyl esterase/lipase